MDRRTVLTKTAKGLMEVTGKTSLLPRDLRNVLSQVDGKATVGDLHQKLDKFSETKLIDTLGKLVKDGFVREFVSAPASVSPPSQVPIVQEDVDLDFTALISRPPSKAEVTAQNSAEADEVARQVAQARAKQGPDPRAKAEAEAKAKREAEERARREGEAKAKADAEARAKAEAEAKTKREAEERARREAEAKAKADAESRAKADAAARAKRDADERARQQKEEAARREDEARSRLDAEERARKEVETRGQREQEERIRRDLEQRVREAEEQSRRDAEEKRRREAEERARRDARDQARREAEERARREAEEKARREAEERARRETAERAKREAEEAERRRDEEERARRDAERRARDEEKARAKAEAEAAARARREERAREKADADETASAREREREKDAAVVAARLERIRSGKGKGGGPGKYVGFAAIAAVIGGLVYLHFMPLDIAKYEALASQRVGQPVKIGSGNLTLIPSPAIRFENVTIGAGKNVRIASVAATPEFRAVFADPPVLKSLDMSGVTLDAAGLAGVLLGRSQGNVLGIERVRATGVKLVMPGLNLPELDATLAFQPDGAMQKISVSNPGKTLVAEIRPQGVGRVAVDASMGSAKALFGLPFEVESVSAKGVATASEFTASELDAKTFGGIVRGKGTLRWNGPLGFDGTLEARGLDAKLLTPLLNGTVQGPMAIAAHGDTLAKLGDGARLDWSFALQNGLINGIDLPRTLQTGKSVGGTTKIDQMTGQVSVGDGRAALRNVRIVGGPMQANGTLEIEGGKTLAGRFSADMKTPGAPLRATLVVSGTPTQLSVKR
ncbi:MAG TPA: hypothetical protein VLD36_14675 [Burkholderiales bacterium]|nr:hypothetical protein [Burkholderiales bacterium]